MHVDYASKSIFFHNPKTAGRSTIVSLGLPDDTHMKLVHFGPMEARRCIFQESWSDYFTFSFVRNPWDRMVSLYEYHRSIEYAQFQNMNTSHLIARQYDFSDWVHINEMKLRRSNWFGVPQSFWTAGVSAVYRLEEYESAFGEIAKRMGKKATPLHINRTAHRDYRKYYLRKKTIETIRAIDGDIIDAFGYEF